MPFKTQLRREDRPAQLREPLGEVVVLEAAPGLQNGDPITLLSQAQRRHAAAEAGSDNQVVVVMCLCFIVRSLARVSRFRYSPESGSSL